MRNGIWATPEQHRDQYTIFAPSLDDIIPPDHPIRRLEELLLRVDWSAWEARYGGPRGRPPFHPRLVAGAILYGLTKKIRSTRDLEEATKVRVDYMWLLHGMTIDHSTFSDFRTKFEEELPDLFKQLAVISLTGNMDVELAVDGTRVRANSSRTGALTAEGIERRAQRVADQLAEALEKMKQQDLLEDHACCSAEELEKEIAGLKAQQAKLTCALEEARRRDEAKAQKADKRRAEKARVPLTDPDSHVLQNKEGGYAPNYTPTAAVDTSTGTIIAADVPEGNDEASVVDDAVSATQQTSGENPSRVLFDSGFATGTNLEGLAQKGIDVYAPAGTPKQDNPAVRPDPSVPVPPEQWDALPMQGKKKRVLTKEAFIYDDEQDCYFCPMGRKLVLARRLRPAGRRHDVEVAEYMCENCAGCPLAQRCLSRNAKRRRVSRDQFEPYREDLYERMNTDEAKEIYRRRAPAAEGVFGYIKHGMGVRQFLLRGLNKVRIEWLWVCAAYNVRRMIAPAAQPANSGGDTPQPAHGSVSGCLWPDFRKAMAARAFSVPIRFLSGCIRSLRPNPHDFGYALI